MSKSSCWVSQQLMVNWCFTALEDTHHIILSLTVLNHTPLVLGGVTHPHNTTLCHHPPSQVEIRLTTRLVATLPRLTTHLDIMSGVIENGEAAVNGDGVVAPNPEFSWL